MLGARLRYEQYDEAHHNILAVADVYLGSPAQEADLQPFKDFILGTQELSFCDLESFAKYIAINQNQEVDLYVYNVDEETVRCARVLPRDNWSGQGLIGADISFGYLNRLPMRKRDLANEKKAESMRQIFGGLTGGSSSNSTDPSGQGRVPTSEGLSSDEDDPRPCSKPGSSSDLVTPTTRQVEAINYVEAGEGEDGEESYYDEEDDEKGEAPTPQLGIENGGDANGRSLMEEQVD